jgi:hypothetical protein
MLFLPVAKFIVPDWGDKVDSGIELSYLTARLHRRTRRYDHPMPGTMNLVTVVKKSVDIFLGQLVVRHTEGREHTWPEHTKIVFFITH